MPYLCKIRLTKKSILPILVISTLIYITLLGLFGTYSSRFHWSIRLSYSGDYRTRDHPWCWISRSKRIRPTAVLLCGYLKGEASYLGNLFNKHPDVFYWFEPMAGFYSTKYFHDKIYPLSLLYETTRYQSRNQSSGNHTLLPEIVPNSEPERLKYFDYLMDLLRCELKHLPPDFFTHSGLRQSDHTMGLYSCIQRSFHPNLVIKEAFRHIRVICGGPSYDNREARLNTHGDRCSKLLNSLRMGGLGLNYSLVQNGYTEYQIQLKKGVYKCLKSTSDVCALKKVTVANVLRYHMQDIGLMLSRNPSLVVIHFVRDPRGILDSRMQAGHFTQSGMLEQASMEQLRIHAHALCQKMYTDLKAVNEYRQIYPGRIMTIRYEDLALEPEETVQRILDLAGLKSGKTTKTWLMQNYNTLGMKKKKKRKKFKLYKNATLEAISWVKRLNPGTLSVINHVCYEVLTQLRYPMNV